MNDFPVTMVQDSCDQDDVLDNGVWQKPMGLYWDIDKDLYNLWRGVATWNG